MRRRARRGRIAIIGALVALLLFLAWLLELPGGTWPKPGDGGTAKVGGGAGGGAAGEQTAETGPERPEAGGTTGAGGAAAAGGAPGEPDAGTGPRGGEPSPAGPPPEDWLAGQREAFLGLLGDDRVGDARAIVARLRANGHQTALDLAAELDRELMRHLRRLEQGFRTAWDGGDLGAAEAALRPLRQGFPERAELLLGGPLRRAEVGEDELRGLAAALDDVLPRILDAGRTLVRLEGRFAVVRVPGTKGGHRDVKVPLTDLDPATMYRTLDAAGARARATVLARLYLADDRPLAAALALRGRLSLPEALPDPGR
ncbi:MAG: hypothetical protein R3F30_02575 [Planctomycetota bacterium]